MSNPLNRALEPMELTQEEWDELQGMLTHPTSRRPCGAPWRADGARTLGKSVPDASDYARLRCPRPDAAHARAARARGTCMPALWGA